MARDTGGAEASEPDFRLLAESATDVIFLTGPSHLIEWASPSVTEVLGWRVDEVMGRRVPDLMHPEDLARQMARMRELQASGDSGGQFQSRFRTAEGGWRWVSGGGRAVRDADGRIIGGVDTLRDIQAEHDALVALEASDAHFRLLAENTTDVIMQLTGDGRVAWTSPSVQRVLGWTPARVVGRSAFDLVQPDDLTILADMLAEGEHSAGPLVCDLRFRKADGGHVWMEASTQRVPRAKNSPVTLVTRLRDVDAQRRAFQEVARSERRFRTALNSAPIGMAVGEVSGALTEVNQALCTMLGYSAQALVARSFLDLVHPDDEDRYRAMRQEARETDAGSVTTEVRLVTAEGGSVRVQLALGVVREEGGQPTSFVWQIVDVTEIRRAHELLEFLAAHDPLTDVKNRRAVMGILTSMLQADAVGEGSAAVLYADIDGLKPVNDHLGHAAGDTLIVQVARRFSRVLGPDDTIGRLGGDEFVALLGAVADVTEAAAIAERVRLAVSEPLDIDGTQVMPAVSIGVAVAGAGEQAEPLLRRADRALYRAKHAGGNRVVVDDAAPAAGD